MNAVYQFSARMSIALKWGKETLAGGGLHNRQFNDFVPSGDPLAAFFAPPSTVFTPRVLKDGADSVGALGALNRVYINIGVFSEEWLRHFKALVGGKPISPNHIETARENSVYWQATEAQTINMARFFLGETSRIISRTHPEAQRTSPTDETTLTRGKVVFAERCARCHSSKQSRGCHPDSICGTPTARIIWRAGTSTGSGRRPRSSRSRCATSCSRRISSPTTICRQSFECR